jgi:hypothetical protein
MRELLTKYVLAMITASIAFIEPTFNFLYAIVAVITIDCFSAYNLNRRIRRKFPNYAKGKLESKKALKMIYTIGKVYGVILIIWFIEKNIIKDLSFDVTKYVAALFCFIQLISVLENESSCNDAWWARALQKFLMDKSKRHFDMDIDIDKLREEQEEEDKKKYGGKNNENNK